MAIKALINGKVQAGLAIDDRGLQYGDGVFETIAVARAGPLCLDEHCSRSAGVWPARMLAGQPFKPGPITRRIHRALIGENAIIPPC